MNRKQMKAVARAGMTLCLGGLVISGMRPCRRQRPEHVWYGIAMIGFSVWHYNLNTPPCRARSKYSIR